jgi:nitroreductase
MPTTDAPNAPPPPEFGEPLPVLPSAEALAFLARRRSASATTLGPPGPDAGQLNDLLRIATRVPDHGKLAPWRFILLGGEDKAVFVARLGAIARDRPDADKASAALAKASPRRSRSRCVAATAQRQDPEWEQVLSVGALNMNLLLAAQAMGFGANWITDWYSEDPRALALLGVGAGERVAGSSIWARPRRRRWSGRGPTSTSS